MKKLNCVKPVYASYGLDYIIVTENDEPITTDDLYDRGIYVQELTEKQEQWLEQLLTNETDDSMTIRFEFECRSYLGTITCDMDGIVLYAEQEIF